MSARSGAGLLAVLLAWPSIGAAAPGAGPDATRDAAITASVQRCLRQLQPQDDVGYARIAARCPELAAQLRGSALAPWLPPGWTEAHNDLSAAGLAELLRLQGEWQRAGAGAAPRAQPERLRQLVSDLQLQQAQHNSLWKRFRSWLRSIFEKQDKPDATDNGLGDWLRAHGVSDSIWSVAQWTALGLLALLLGRVGWLELRALGGRRRLRAAEAAFAGSAAAVPTLAQIEAAPLQRQPGMLLALIADLLARRRLVRRAAALTPNELAERAPLPEALLRQQLRELAEVADPARFAAQAPEPGLLQRAVDAGRALLAGIRGTGRA